MPEGAKNLPPLSLDSPAPESSPDPGMKGDGDDVSTMDARVQAASIVSDAMESGDPKAFADALDSYIDMHMAQGGGPMGADSGLPKAKPKLVIAVGPGSK